MASIEQALAAVRASSSRTESIIADRAQMKSQLSAVLANTKLTPEQQAQIDEIFDIETADAKRIDEALNANVPPASEVKGTVDAGVGGNVKPEPAPEGGANLQPDTAASSGQPIETTQTGTSGSTPDK